MNGRRREVGRRREQDRCSVQMPLLHVVAGVCAAGGMLDADDGGSDPIQNHNTTRQGL